MAYLKLKREVAMIVAILLLLSFISGIYYIGEAKEEVVAKLLVSVYDKNGKTQMWKVIPQR